MRSILIFGAAAALTAGVALAHGGSHGTNSTSGEPGDPKKATRTVKLDASEYAFSEQALSFKAGETVKFVVSNKGKLKHELTIGDAAEQAEHWHPQRIDEEQKLISIQRFEVGITEQVLGANVPRINDECRDPGEASEGQHRRSDRPPRSTDDDKHRAQDHGDRRRGHHHVWWRTETQTHQDETGVRSQP